MSPRTAKKAKPDAINSSDPQQFLAAALAPQRCRCDRPHLLRDEYGPVRCVRCGRGPGAMTDHEARTDRPAGRRTGAARGTLADEGGGGRALRVLRPIDEAGDA